MAGQPFQPRDLVTSLSEYSPIMLQALTRIWQATPANILDNEGTARALAEAMQSTDKVQRIVDELSYAARQALALLMNHPEGLPSYRLTINFGQIRKLGPARMDREQPWANPQSALEELFYKGILHRAYGTVTSTLGEILWVPAEILSVLTPVTSETESTDAFQGPGTVLSHEHLICEDIMAILSKLKKTPVQKMRGPDSPLKLPWDQLDLHGRLMGGFNPERLQFLEHLLVRSRLVEVQNGMLQPGIRARNWLRSEETRRLIVLWNAWRDNHAAREIASLGVEIKGHKTLNLAEARQNLSALMAALPAGKWFALDEIIARLKIAHPDYLRTDGDFDAWEVVTGATDTPRRGYATWDLLEAKLAESLITQGLYWLGLVNLGEAEAKRVYIQLTQAGSDVLNKTVPLVTEPSPVNAGIDDRFMVTIPVRDTLYDRFQLERFCTWQNQDELARYLLSEQSVWEGVNSGITIEQMMRFLERLAAGRFSPVVKRSMLAWGGHFGRVNLQKAVVIQVADEQVMAQLLSHANIRRLLGASISPTQRLVPAANIDLLIERLKQIGIWPSIKL